MFICPLFVVWVSNGWDPALGNIITFNLMKSSPTDSSFFGGGVQTNMPSYENYGQKCVSDIFHFFLTA